MPRARKPRAETTEPADDESAEGGQRPSQLDQIRAAISQPASRPEPEELEELPAPEEEPELPAHVEEPVLEAPEAPEPAAEATPEPPEQPAAEAHPAPVSPWVPPPTHAPGVAAAAQSRPGSSSLALGIVLVVVGAFFLVMRVFNLDLSSYGWPLFVIIPGLTLLVVGFISLGTGALIPGGIITMAGLILAYQNATSDWPSWAYAWALVAPGGVGIGVFLAGLRNHDPRETRQGRTLMLWAVMIFFIGFVFFESVLDISGIDYGIVGRAALPALLIIIGAVLLARSWQRGRRA